MVPAAAVIPTMELKNIVWDLFFESWCGLPYFFLKS
jgi:hypothetical protein